MFLEGDKLAKYLVSPKQNSYTRELLRIEKCTKDDIKIEVECPSSSLFETEVSPNCSRLPSEEDDYTEYINKPNTKAKRKIEVCNCPHCGKHYVNSNQPQTHVRNVHLKIFRIKFPICGKGFPNNPRKNVHMLSIHKDDPTT